MNAARLIATLAAVACVAPAFAQDAAVATVVSANTRVLVQRGQDFLPAQANMTLRAGDKLVVLEGGTLQLACGNTPAGTISETGVYPVPTCQTRVAAAVPPAPAPAPAAVAASGPNWTTVGVVGAGVVLAAAAAFGGGDDKPVSP